MNSPQMLKLKSFDFTDSDSKKIYDMTQKTVENFNIYVSDFYETIHILRENLKESIDQQDHNKSDEIKNNIAYVENKISELYQAMQIIADDMSSLVELICI